MGLRDIKIPRTTVKYAGTDLQLRGISFSDVMEVANTYGPQAAMVFGKLQSGQSLESADVRAIIGSLAKEVPEMVAALIALATDEYTEDTVAIAMKIPFNVQIECLEAIFHRTFESEADVKKLVESLTRMAIGTSGVLKETQFPLPNGIGDSDEA